MPLQIFISGGSLYFTHTHTHTLTSNSRPCQESFPESSGGVSFPTVQQAPPPQCQNKTGQRLKSRPIINLGGDTCLYVREGGREEEEEEEEEVVGVRLRREVPDEQQTRALCL